MASGTIHSNIEQYADLTSSLPSEVEGYNNGGVRVKRSGDAVTIYLSLKDISGNNNGKSLTNILPDWANPVTTLNPLKINVTSLMSDGSVSGITAVNLSGRSLGILRINSTGNCSCFDEWKSSSGLLGSRWS